VQAHDTSRVSPLTRALKPKNDPKGVTANWHHTSRDGLGGSQLHAKWSYSQLPNSFPNEGDLVSKCVPICPILELTKTKNPASSLQKTLGFM